MSSPESSPENESHEARLKRMYMRAHRRGTKEMDLILGPYAAAQLPGMNAAALALFDKLLAENDQDLYAWVTGHGQVPPEFTALMADITSHAGLP